jgi:predicted phosphoribosyltransferase
LARALAGYAGRPDVVVLALPRGGVPVAYEVARALDAPLDVLLVRKLGVPGREELAFGALATGGVRVLNEDLVQRLAIPPRVIAAVLRQCWSPVCDPPGHFLFLGAVRSEEKTYAAVRQTAVWC